MENIQNIALALEPWQQLINSFFLFFIFYCVGAYVAVIKNERFEEKPEENNRGRF